MFRYERTGSIEFLRVRYRGNGLTLVSGGRPPKRIIIYLFDILLKYSNESLHFVTVVLRTFSVFQTNLLT